MKIYLPTLILIILLWLPDPVHAQAASHAEIEEVLNLEARHQKLRVLSQEAALGFEENLQKALNMIADKSQPVSQVLPSGEEVQLQGLDAGGLPLYYTTENINAAATIGTDKLWPTGPSGLALSGESAFLEGKLGIWDGGRVLHTHQELTGRIKLEDNASLSSHATHVAGTMIASGVNLDAKGMSFGATRLRSWDYSNDVSEIAGAAASLLVSNHSYGAIAGWRNNTSRAGTSADPTWEWWGDPRISTFEDYRLGNYNDKARDWDHIMYNAPYYLMVKSSGNKRNDNGPNTGQPYWTRTASGGWERVASRQSGAVSSNDSYDNIPLYGNAKNLLLVGAVQTMPAGYTQPSDVKMSTFSSWGPTDDGRIKPDVVANGVNLYSAGSTSDAAYRTTSGTSMAAPNASGSLFLLQELHHRMYDSFMLSSTLRGLVIHTADEAGTDPGPDYTFGYGLINMEEAARHIANMGSGYHLEEVALSQGDTIVREVVATADGPLVITISWTDPAGTPLPFNADMLNNRNPLLVNDLDLRIIDDQDIFYPWLLNPEYPEAPAILGDNIVDNVEQVIVEQPIPGKTYTVRITHKGTLTDELQVFSLLASGMGGSVACESSAQSDTGARIDGFRLGSIDNRTDEGCHGYRAFTDQVTGAQIGTSIPFQVDLGSCDAQNPRMLKMYVDWNADNVFEISEQVAVSEVFSQSGTFEGSLDVPSGTKSGRMVRLRIVLVETNDPDLIQPCGTYLAGETQDYLLRIEHAATDLSLEKILYPKGGEANAHTNQRVSLLIRNKGEKSIGSFDSEIEVYEDDVRILHLEETFAQELTSQLSIQLQAGTTFNTQPGKSYRVVAHITTEGDLVPENNSKEQVFTTAELDDPVASSSATRCEDSDTLVLKASADDLVFWHDATGKMIAAGERTTAHMPEGTMVYVGVNTLSETIGPEGKNTEPWTKGTYTQASVMPYFTTQVPIVIQSATLYAGWPGQVTLQVETADGSELVAQTTLYIEATRNPANRFPGVPDDPSDQGREYQLNLAIPEPGDYLLKVIFDDELTLFRNNANTHSPYPYTLPGAMSITGSSGTSPENHYYWLYNVLIRSLGNPGMITSQEIEILESPQVNINATPHNNTSWILDIGDQTGNNIVWNTGETTPEIIVSEPDTYTVWVTNDLGCTREVSLEVQVDNTSITRDSLEEVALYPNPARGYFVLESQTPVQVEVFNMNGIKLISALLADTHHRIDVSALPPSVYMVRVVDNHSKGQKRILLLVQ